MTGPEQNGGARPDGRARWDDQAPDGRGPEGRGSSGRARQRYEDVPGRARDDRERQLREDREQRQRYEGEERQRYGGPGEARGERRDRDWDRERDQGRGRDRDRDREGDRDRERGPEQEQGQEGARVPEDQERDGRRGEARGAARDARGEGRARDRWSPEASGRPRGPLLGEYAPPYRHRSGRVAAVLLYRNGGHRVVWPDRVEDVNKPLLGSPYTVFEVLLGRNLTEFRLQLPAAGDGVFFEAVAKVHWMVTDPYLVVQEQVEDVAELLHDELLDRLRRLSRRFRITEAQRVDEAVHEELSAGRLVLGRDIGLRTRVHVFIDLDDSVKAEVYRRDRVGVTMEADAREAEAERLKDAADRTLIAERAREMEALFLRGDLAQIAHHMAMHPDKQWDMRMQLQRERREGQEDYLAVFNRLLDTGVLERHDIGEQMYQVLMYLRTQTSNVVGNITDHVLNPAGGSGGSRPRRALEEGTPEPVRPDWGDEHGDGRDGRGSRDGRDSRGSRDGRESREGRGSRDGRERAEREERGERGERGEREERADAPHDRRVYEPTHVESGSDRERERERERERDREREEYRDRNRDRYAYGYGDGDTDRERGPGRGPRDGDRDRYEGDDSYDRFDRDDPYDRTGTDPSRRSSGTARPGRHSSEFDDWDEER
ncbi:hypothetical protein ACFTWD_14380 [Streptomyces sp. NPDC056943]|uniref:hypothetical protein n=1 Tax=Streptomyces sp. NPDC056943 TaxID=3345971 RepID=UPI0036401C1F